MKNFDFIEMWANTNCYLPSHCGNLHRVGNFLFSYDTPIAEKTADGVRINTRKYSQTTSTHQNAVRRAFAWGKIEECTEGEMYSRYLDCMNAALCA